MSKPVQITLQHTHLDPKHVTFSYAYDAAYLASIVISREIWDMLGNPHTITTRMEGI
jgi:hypothetical protein